MCGRYVRRSDKQKIAEHFRANPNPANFPLPDADYNVAPTTHQPIIRQSKETGYRELVLARWGLVPFFTKDLKDVKGLSTINARAETITKAPTWREPFKKRRCIIPVNNFYEWPKEGKPPKQPYSFELANGNLMGFAGLWDAWKDGQGHWLQSFAIVTTEANELMARIHPRMSVILHSRDYDRWLDREETERPPLDLLRPDESEEMEVHEANPKVGSSSCISSAESTEVLPFRTLCFGPRTAGAGLLSMMWPVTSQSNSIRIAARCCFTVGFECVRPSCST